MSFDTRGQRDNHSAMCRGSCTVQYANKVVTLQKDEKGAFICYCAHSNCPKPFKNARSLKAHALRAAQEWKGPTLVLFPLFYSNL
jgi:hypothetical protein